MRATWADDNGTVPDKGEVVLKEMGEGGTWSIIVGS